MAVINFTDVPDQKNFDVLPTGEYVVQIADVSTREASGKAKNPGALNIRWTFEVIQQGEHNGRKVFDNQTAVKESMWKIKALLNALDLDTSTMKYDDEDHAFIFTDEDGGESTLDLEDLIGQTLKIQVGVRPARKDEETGQEYQKQNRVNAFFTHEASDEELMA